MQSAVGIPTSGRQPIANPSASVSASRRGEIPVRSHAFTWYFRVCSQLFISSSDITFVCQKQIGVRRIFSERTKFVLRTESILAIWQRGLYHLRRTRALRMGNTRPTLLFPA